MPIYDTHSSYTDNYSNNNAVFSPYEHSTSPTYDHHNNMEYTHQHTQSSYHPSITSYFEVKSDGNTTYYQPLKQSPRQAASVPACSPNHERPHHPPPSHMETPHYSHRGDYHTTNTSPVPCVESNPTPLLPTKLAIKRKGAPELIPIEPKHVKIEHHLEQQKHDMASLDREEMNPIKLSEHTPGINLDLSNFADIFDFSGLVQQDEGLGLAGRPKAATLVANEVSVQDSEQDEGKKHEQTEHCSKGSVVCSNSPAPQAAKPSSTVSYSESNSEQHTADDSNISEQNTSEVPNSQVHHRSLEHQTSCEHDDSCKYPNNSEQQDGSDHADNPVVAEIVPHVASKHKLLPPCGTTTTTLATLDPHHAPTDEESEGYINFLVRMYLGKDERQISTLKSEFTVYTADLQKAYSNHRANHGDGYNSYKGHSGQYEFSWYNADGYHRGHHHGGSSFSPLNVSARFEYPKSHHAEFSKHDRPAFYHHHDHQ